MRISDWSSDVCSSDLWRAVNADALDGRLAIVGQNNIDGECAFVALIFQRATFAFRHKVALDAIIYAGDVAGFIEIINLSTDDLVARCWLRVVMKGGDGLPVIPDGCQFHKNGFAVFPCQKIGRASCREGVCQYV